jgi:hypothetical protein
MSEVVHIKWYATILRGDLFADAVAEMSPIALRYGATKYAVQRSNDDRYNILQMIWFSDHGDWYRFWESPELIEFRARYSGKYQAPITYTPYEELAGGELGPQASAPEQEPFEQESALEREPAPEVSPSAA